METPILVTILVHLQGTTYHGVISEDILISQLPIALAEYQMFNSIDVFVDDNGLIKKESSVPSINDVVAKNVDIEYCVKEERIIDYRGDHKKEYLIKDFISQYTHIVNSGGLDREQNNNRIYITEYFTPKMVSRNSGEIVINETNLLRFIQIVSSSIKGGGIIQFYVYRENSIRLLSEILKTNKLEAKTLDNIRIESEDIKPGDTVLLMEPVQSTGFRYFNVSYNVKSHGNDHNLII